MAGDLIDAYSSQVLIKNVRGFDVFTAHDRLAMGAALRPKEGRAAA